MRWFVPAVRQGRRLLSPPTGENREQGAAEQERPEADRAAQGDPPRGQQAQADHRREREPERDAQHAAGHVARSRRLINEGNYPEAEQDLAEAISLDPSNNEAHLLMAQVYEGEGRHQDAAAQLETALKLSNSVGAQLWLARIYLSLGQFPKAEEHSRAALALAPANHEAERLAREVQQRVSAAGSEP